MLNTIRISTKDTATPATEAAVKGGSEIQNCPHKKNDPQLDEPLSRPLFVKIPEACRLMGIGKTKLYDEVGKQKVTFKHCGRSTLVCRASIEDWANNLKSYDPNK